MDERTSQNDNMLGAYDFADANPNHLAEYFQQKGVRQLDADIRDAFPDSESVNAALRLLLRVAKSVGKQELPKAS